MRLLAVCLLVLPVCLAQPEAKGTVVSAKDTLPVKAVGSAKADGPIHVGTDGLKLKKIPDLGEHRLPVIDRPGLVRPIAKKDPTGRKQRKLNKKGQRKWRPRGRGGRKRKWGQSRKLNNIKRKITNMANRKKSGQQPRDLKALEAKVYELLERMVASHKDGSSSKLTTKHIADQIFAMYGRSNKCNLGKSAPKKTSRKMRNLRPKKRQFSVRSKGRKAERAKNRTAKRTQNRSAKKAQRQSKRKMRLDRRRKKQIVKSALNKPIKKDMKIELKEVLKDKKRNVKGEQKMKLKGEKHLKLKGSRPTPNLGQKILDALPGPSSTNH